MIKIKNVDVYGWGAAIRGMRNPMNSWAMSDSYHCSMQACGTEECDKWTDYDDELVDCVCEYVVGDNDLALMKKLANAGDDHGKFLRMINVSLDITSSLYWFKEFDTYKIGTVANSCSTMHKIHAKEFTMDDFSCEHLDKEGRKFLHQTISYLNRNREKFLGTKDKRYWWNMIQSLPSSYNQLRTVQLNYQVLKAMYHARRNHKLDEWRTFCDWIETLPYSELITKKGCEQNERQESDASKQGS